MAKKQGPTTHYPPLTEAQRIDLFLHMIGSLAIFSGLPKQTLIETFIAAATCEMVDLHQSEATFIDQSGHFVTKLEIKIPIDHQPQRDQPFNGIRLSARLAKRNVN